MLSSTAPTQTVPLSTSLGISKSLGSIFSSSLTSVQIWKERRPKDSPFYLIRKPNTFLCTSQPLSLETQPSTSVQQHTLLPRHLQPVFKPALWAGVTPFCNVRHSMRAFVTLFVNGKKHKDIKVYMIRPKVTQEV